MRTAVQPENEKLIVNPRDELIQEMMALRDRKFKIQKEEKFAAEIRDRELRKSRKKQAYEWSFKTLVRKYFKLGEEDIKELNADKIEDLEKLIYDLAQKRWKVQRIFLYTLTLGLAKFFPPVTEWEWSYPIFQMVKMHKWYKENFGSVAKAILYGA